MKLSRKEKEQIKKVAWELLDTLKAERLVLDWRKKQQTRAAVELTIEKVLEELPLFTNRINTNRSAALLTNISTKIIMGKEIVYTHRVYC